VRNLATSFTKWIQADVALLLCCGDEEEEKDPKRRRFWVHDIKTVRRIPPSIPRIVSRCRALSVSLPTEQESVGVVFPFRIIKRN